MIGNIGEDVIISLQIDIGRESIAPGTVGRLVEIFNEKHCSVMFDGRGKVKVHRDCIRKKNFSTGDRVRLVTQVEAPGGGLLVAPGTEGRVVKCWISSSIKYLYSVAFPGDMTVNFEAHQLRHIAEIEGDMNINELAKYMVHIGGGCNPNSVPEWFRPVVRALNDMPQLSQMGPAQMEFVITRHMEYRCINTRDDLVANVLFGISVSAGHPQIKTMWDKLHAYRDKLNIEWKKLDKLIPIDFQYAALRAYAETLNE